MPDADANSRPLVSVVVTSYNYEKYIGTTLQSIIDQTVQDFEVVVVDDASTDSSRDVIKGFADPRIKLHVNDSNIGLIPTYNKGVSLAEGKYLCYLDSDDWIEPRKLEEQLDYFRHNPDADIVATYVRFVGDDGGPHQRSAELETLLNRPYDLNSLATWVGWNKLVTSSIMLRREVHNRIGARDITMSAASDFDLWARAFAQGFRFGMVPMPLLNYRLHDSSAGQRNDLLNFLEISYLLRKNILPKIDAVSDFDLFSQFVDWHVTQPQFRSLTDVQAHRLLGLLGSAGPCFDFNAFKRQVMEDGNPSLLSAGRRLFALYGHHPSSLKTERDIAWRDEQLGERDRLIAWHREELAARDNDIAWRDEKIAAHDREIAWRDAELAARERDIAWHGERLAERDHVLAWHRDELAGRDSDIAWRDEQLAERDRVLAWHRDELAARDRDIAWRDEQLAERDRVVAWHRDELAARDRDIVWRDEQLALKTPT